MTYRSAMSGPLAAAMCALVAAAQTPPKFDPAAMQKQLEALQKAMEGSAREASPCVDHRELKALLPEKIGQFTRKSASSERNSAMGMTMVTAEATYEGPKGGQLKLTLSDLAGAGAAAVFGRMTMAAVEVDREGDEGYEKSRLISGHKALETYRHRDRSGNIVLQADRFQVEVQGSQIPPEILSEAVQAIDLKALTALKPAGAK